MRSDCWPRQTGGYESLLPAWRCCDVPVYQFIDRDDLAGTDSVSKLVSREPCLEELGTSNAPCWVPSPSLDAYFVRNYCAPRTHQSAGVDSYVRGNPRMRWAMMFLFTWVVPPAIVNDRIATRSRPHRPALASGPSTSPATSPRCCSASLQTSLAMLDSGPTSRPCSAPEMARCESSLSSSPSRYTRASFCRTTASCAAVPCLA